MSTTPGRFEGVGVVCEANVFFDGKVVSHTVLFSDGSKKSLGLIYPGTYRFNTQVAENMAITKGSCKAKIGDGGEWRQYGPGQSFDVAAGSFFEITAESGIVQYVCSFG